MGFWDGESTEKREECGAKRGRRRGRPRKTEPNVIGDSKNESILDQDAPALVTEAVLIQTPVSLEAQVSDATGAVFEELKPTPQAPVTALGPAVDIPPISVQDDAPTAASASVPLLPVIQGPMYTEPQSKPALDQVLIEDLGPDEEEDLCPSQDQQADEGCSGEPVEPTFLSHPTLSSPPAPQQEYVPGNSF
ncbi:hypothetical protein NQD34_000782 [Periophthalmus magnuspinnatus]|nr:hypothetical protein NQD34_000782 [Periophthalmus magnuspinnatus]